MKLATRTLGAGALIGLLLPLGSQVYPGTTQAASACTGAKTSLIAGGWSGADQESTMVRHELAQFMAANPCVSITYKSQPANYQQKIQTEFASGDQPDVMYLSPDMITNEGKAGKLLALDSYLSKDGVKTSAYIPSLLKTFQYNGKTYGLPKDWGTLGIFYNKAIFDAKHIAYPSNNLTFDQFRALAKKVYTPSSNPAKVVYGTMIPSLDIVRFMAIIYGYGSQIMNPDTGQILFNNNKTIQAAEYWTGMQLVDHSATVPSTVGDSWQGDSFGKGKVAMVFEGGWLTPYLRSTYPKINFGVAQIPIGPAGRADPVFTNAWGASASTKNPAIAAKLVEYLTGTQTQTYQTNIGFSLPTLSSLQNLPYLKTHPEASNLFASYKVGQLGNFKSYDSQVNKVLGDALTSILLGKQTAQQAIPAAAKTLQSQITAVP
ncbi:MAG TPA: ABC transporter substrate-binding protein [Chloroflexota bacterium]|nr:ABC transporter substrate-binding protein [Chloroflexota bacterium]